jgi:hypothetical protein
MQLSIIVRVMISNGILLLCLSINVSRLYVSFNLEIGFNVSSMFSHQSLLFVACNVVIKMSLTLRNIINSFLAI